MPRVIHKARLTGLRFARIGSARLHARRIDSRSDCASNTLTTQAPQLAQSAPSRGSSFAPRQIPQYVMPVADETHPRRAAYPSLLLTIENNVPSLMTSSRSPWEIYAQKRKARDRSWATRVHPVRDGYARAQQHPGLPENRQRRTGLAGMCAQFSIGTSVERLRKNYNSPVEKFT